MGYVNKTLVLVSKTFDKPVDPVSKVFDRTIRIKIKPRYRQSFTFKVVHNTVGNTRNPGTVHDHTCSQPFSVSLFSPAF